VEVLGGIEALSKEATDNNFSGRNRGDYQVSLGTTQVPAMLSYLRVAGAADRNLV
jgi:hypothetical protein